MDSLGIVIIKGLLVIKDNKDSLGIIIIKGLLKINVIINIRIIRNNNKKEFDFNKWLYFILDNELKYWIEYNYDNWFKWIDFVNNK